MMMKLQQALDWVQARQPSARLVGEGCTPVQRVHTDSRSLQAGGGILPVGVQRRQPRREQRHQHQQQNNHQPAEGGGGAAQAA